MVEDKRKCMSAFSKTEEFCDCGTLQQFADNPNLPVEFDTQTNEFQVVFEINGGKGQFNLWHCPLCGGKAPESKRHLLFATISDEERSRLHQITDNLKTLNDVLTILGEPDQDFQNGLIIFIPETETNPSQEQSFRTLVYPNISEVADIRITVYPDEKVGIGFTGKSVRNKKADK